MKKQLTLLLTLLVSIGTFAQSTDEIDFVQSIWGMEKRALVEEYMDLSDQEGTTFWPAYDSYEASRKDLGKDRIAILEQYATDYESLTGEEATDLINRAIANNISIQKLMKKTYKNMSKSIDPLRVAKFVQLENYLLISIQMEIQQNIPFIGELEDKVVD